MKNKIFNAINVVGIIKSVLLGTIITLVGVLVLAVILKFVDIPTNTIGYINSAIKLVAIFLTIFSLSKRIDSNLLLNSIVSGVVYALFNYLVFSIINGKFNFGSNNIIDIVFALVVAVISSVTVSLFKKKTV